jgi:uncharacterized membrane protein
LELFGKFFVTDESSVNFWLKEKLWKFFKHPTTPREKCAMNLKKKHKVL